MTTQTREETARAFAETMGWRFHPILPIPHTTPIQGFAPNGWILPTPDAPLHEHLAFVGRVSSARWDHPPYKLHIAYEHGLGAVVWINDVRGDAPDPSHAAMLAAIEARKGR